MKKQMIVGAAIMALTAGAAMGGIAIAGGGTEREAGPRVVAEPLTATEKGPATRAGGATIQTYYLEERVVPDDGQGIVTGLSCPKGNAIGGGAATSEGIVVSYLSQLRPSNFNVSRRTYWVGVDDNAGGAGAGATLEVHCAKGIDVKK
jgi:hypothetical protein